MSNHNLEIPGRVGIGTMVVPGPNAQPVGFPLENPPGNIHVVVAGGLTKRQELAARFLAAMMVGRELPDSAASSVKTACDWADELIAQTELKPPSKHSDGKHGKSRESATATGLIL